MAKTQKLIGVFKYDLFPYRVVHDVTGFDEHGGVITDIGTFEVSNLISILPATQKSDIVNYLRKMGADYKQWVKEKEEFMISDLLETYPALSIMDS